MLAFGAGDVLFTAAALEAQACFALRAAEILVGLYALEPRKNWRISVCACPVLSMNWAIFLLPLGDVAAQHPPQSIHIAQHGQETRQRQAEKRKQTENDSGDERCEAEIIRAVAPCIQFARAFCIFEKKDIGDFLLCFRS